MAFATATLLQVSIPWSVYACLGGAVWLVYTIDHLLDAKQIDEKAVSSRHQFHRDYFALIIRLWIAVLVATLIITIFWLPLITIKFGLVAVGLVIIHLVLVKLLGTKLSILVQKEFGVAMAYAVGVVVGPLSLAGELSEAFIYFTSQVFLLAFINLLEFSYFDKRIDQLQGQVSLSLVLGRKKLRNIIGFLLLVNLIVMQVSIYKFPSFERVYGVLWLAWLVLLVIMLFPKKFIRNEYYRVFGDMVFLFPILLL